MYNCSTRYQSRRHLSASLGMQFSPYKVNFDGVHSGEDFNQCGGETSKRDEKADGNCSTWRQGNRVTLSGEDYNLRELDQRTTNDYDRKQASTRKYYGKETSECNKKEADGNSSKRRQGNRVTVNGEDYNLHESDQRTTNNYDRKQSKYYGKETSEFDKEADGNSFKRWQGNRVTVSGDDYDLRELD
jgi:hypothetical protein